MMEIRKVTGAIGAEVGGVDLSRPLSDGEISAITNALHDHYVVFFREQRPLSEEEHMRVGRYFGTLDISEIQPKPSSNREVLWMEATSAKGRGAEYWHRDRTYLEAPPLGSILQCMVKPDVGGDTCWTSSVAAYEALSEPIQALVDRLSALHSIRPLAARSQDVRDTLGDKIHSFPTAVHPLVEVHPVSGRKALNVNANWTTEIMGLSQEEGRMLLDFLLEHVKRPEFAVRFHWNVGDVAFWDNRTVQHCAIADFNTRRVMKRVALVGHPPKGPESQGMAA
ncbi:taurine dioxygenase [Sphingobium sp. OAS761]|uniref:TauD/TfdA dioxygenase family protein n=1 Tax=Sphingobium sp. OAS761 TaxID=2817901 RepID=UPI00209F3ADD|nr:TauD/TfdA family dioxygenase [Sphingobium sp. OAS761]MCP1470349.1 taurine dioxygenase [Sphingobium sp. OAS761]